MSVTVSGIMINPVGEPVVNAQITLTAVANSLTVLNTFSVTVRTDNTGAYRIQLEEGSYSITVAANGRSFVYGAVTLDDTTGPSTLNQLLKQQIMESELTPDVILYFRQIQQQVANDLATIKVLENSASNSAISAGHSRDEAGQYATDLSAALATAKGYRDQSGISANAAALSQQKSATSESKAKASEDSASLSEQHTLAYRNAAQLAAATAADDASTLAAEQTAAKIKLSVKTDADRAEAARSASEQIETAVDNTARQVAQQHGEAVQAASNAQQSENNAAESDSSAKSAAALAVQSKQLAAGSAELSQQNATLSTADKNATEGFRNEARLSAQEAKEAAESIDISSLGVGLPNQADIQNFDWQNFAFASGANYVTSYNTWVNPPAGVTYNAGTRVSIRVIYISLVNGSRMGLELTPDTGADANFKVYKLLCVGAPGARVFTFRKIQNSAIAVPISEGGTGETTIEGARSVLGGGLPLLHSYQTDTRDHIEAGESPQDGQLLPRALFPDAWAAIQAKRTVISDAEWLADPLKRGCFSSGDGSTTFRIPDKNGKSPGSIGALVGRGDGVKSAGIIGTIQMDAMRNIVGRVSGYSAASSVSRNFAGATGAFVVNGPGDAAAPAHQTTYVNGFGVLGFDASASPNVLTAEENRVLSVTTCWVIKLAGSAFNEGQVNALELASQITLLTTRIETLEATAFTSTKIDNTPWINMTLGSGWTGSVARYRKVLGMVQAVVSLSNTAITNGTTIATLPVGYRPTSIVQIVPFATFSAGTGPTYPARVVFSTDGSIQLHQTAGYGELNFVVMFALK